MSATASMNGGDAVKAPTPTGSKQPFKSGNESQSKKQQAPKAWQGGTNPITQRATSTLPNGNEKPLPKLPTSSLQPKASSDLHADKHAHDRAVFLLAQFIGKDVTISLKNGEQFTGVFSGASLESSKTLYVIKMARRTRLPSHQHANGTDMPQDLVGEGDDHIMSFDIQDTTELVAQDVSTATATSHANGSLGGSFLTDTQISGRDAQLLRQRELQRWDAGPDASIDMSLGDPRSNSDWDQFAVNERMYGVQSTYDENIYTTSIDRGNPEYRRREAEAERIAREIEGSAPSNEHVAEERRRDAHRDDAGDEEEKYSGVRREASALPKRAAGAYVPPSQRPITGAPSVPGAPFDPAIISSQIKATPSPAAVPEPAPAAVLQPTVTVDKSVAGETVPEGDAAAATSASAMKRRENTTEDRVRDTADAFKQFANTEKLRVRQAQEAKRVNQRQEKNVKLNDLKKFAANFKLKSRVPDDLVPILAKDREKQVEIQSKAEEAAKEEEQRAKDRTSDKASSTASPAQAAAVAQPSAAAPPDPRMPFNQQHSRARASQQVRGGPVPPVPGQTPRVPLSQRIQGNQQFYGRQGLPQPLPADLRIPPHVPPPSAGDLPMSPTSATRLNVNAKAFEFRPGASAFTPTGTSPSPQRSASGVMPSPAEPSASFFDKDQSKEIKSFALAFDPLRRMAEAEYSDADKKKYTPNGGLPQAYHTQPVWSVPKEHQNSTYLSMFPKTQSTSTGPSPMPTPNPSGQVPHAHQLPAHMQVPTMAAPNQRPYYQHPQHGHGPSFDPRMQQQFGPNGSVQNSPRAQPMPVAPFNAQMPPMPVQQFPGQPMPGYGMSPSMQYRQPAMQGGPMMMMQNQGPGQMGPMAPGYPPGPQFRGPQMGGHMMVQQPSSGYINGPMPQQGFSPMPPHAQPHMPHMQQHGGPAGYSGSPRPPMMQHGGSHQGFQPGMPMQPHFAPSPGQHPYHMQQRAMSGGHGGFPQMTPRQQHAVPNHPSPGMHGATGQGDEGK